MRLNNITLPPDNMPGLSAETDGLSIGDFNCRRIGVRVNAFRPQFFYSSHKAIGVILQCYNDSAQIAYN